MQNLGGQMRIGPQTLFCGWLQTDRSCCIIDLLAWIWLSKMSKMCERLGNQKAAKRLALEYLGLTRISADSIVVIYVDIA